MDFKRYERNTNIFSKEEVIKIFDKNVCIVGCGGLGGYVIEILARFGVGNLTIIDGDVFDVTNLNRQIFARENNIGTTKVSVIKKELANINSSVKVNPIHAWLDEENCVGLIDKHDLIIDCLDNIQSRLVLANGCKKVGIPYVHGAIEGLWGQVAFVNPDDNLYNRIYTDSKKENHYGNPPVTPAIVATLQANQAIKYLTGKGELLENKLLHIDLLYDEFEFLEFN